MTFCYIWMRSSPRSLSSSKNNISSTALPAAIYSCVCASGIVWPVPSNPFCRPRTRLSNSRHSQVGIRDLETNRRPHVAIEGYVYDCPQRFRRGDLGFQAGREAWGAGPFAHCEIITPIAPPRDGTRVRVCAVACYDAQPERKWYEVNPVLRIDSLEQ